MPKALGLHFSSPPAPKGHVNSYICSDLTISTAVWLVVTFLSLNWGLEGDLPKDTEKMATQRETSGLKIDLIAPGPIKV